MGTRLRVFGPDHEWQHVDYRCSTTNDITKIIREEFKKGTDITIILEPFGDGSPFDFPYGPRVQTDDTPRPIVPSLAEDAGQ